MQKGYVNRNGNCDREDINTTNIYTLVDNMLKEIFGDQNRLPEATKAALRISHRRVIISYLNKAVSCASRGEIKKGMDYLRKGRNSLEDVIHKYVKERKGVQINNGGKILDTILQNMADMYNSYVDATLALIMQGYREGQEVEESIKAILEGEKALKSAGISLPGKSVMEKLEEMLNFKREGMEYKPAFLGYGGV